MDAQRLLKVVLNVSVNALLMRCSSTCTSSLLLEGVLVRVFNVP